MEQLDRLKRDIRAAAIHLTETEARFLVDNYYIMQEDRKRAGNQERALEESREPHDVINWLASNAKMMEDELRKVLEVYAGSKPVGRWMMSLTGIGPVISAGMLAHIDIKECPTAGHMWRFAGLDPTSHWGKGERRPWNAQLKTLCWKTGQSFMKFSNHPDCFYGPLYRQRKEYEQRRNDSGGNVETARRILSEKNFDRSTEAYKHLSTGKLPPAQIDARARRWAVKMFLSHLQAVWWWNEFVKVPPVPYVHGIMGHVDYVMPPNLDHFPGLAERLSVTNRAAPSRP
jgi:hypothetical protein